MKEKQIFKHKNEFLLDTYVVIEHVKWFSMSDSAVQH